MQLIGLFGLLLTSGNQAKAPEAILDAAVQEISTKFDTVPQISTGELAAWLADPAREAPLLLDVREPDDRSIIAFCVAERLPVWTRI